MVDLNILGSVCRRMLIVLTSWVMKLAFKVVMMITISSISYEIEPAHRSLWLLTKCTSDTEDGYIVWRNHTDVLCKTPTGFNPQHGGLLLCGYIRRRLLLTVIQCLVGRLQFIMYHDLHEVPPLIFVFDLMKIFQLDFLVQNHCCIQKSWFPIIPEDSFKVTFKILWSFNRSPARIYDSIEYKIKSMVLDP